MSQIGFREILRCVGMRLRIDRGEVLLPLRITDVDLSAACKDLPIARVASRQDAIEHIDSTSDTFDEIERCANAHEVSRLLFWQYIGRPVRYLVHRLVRFSDGQATD